MASRDTQLNIIVNAKNQTARAFSKVERGLSGMTTWAKRNEAAFRSMRNTGAIALATLSAASAKLITDSAQSLQIEESYRRMTKQAQISSDALLKQLQETSAGTVSATNLMLSANRAMALGVGEDMDTITTLMEIARVKGRALGLDTTQAFNDIVTGIGRGSPLILDNLGITIKLGEAQEMYAEKLGKTSAELTDAEKKQALLNAVMESGKEELAAAGEIQVTTAEKLQKLKAQFSDTADELGRALIPAATKLLEAVTPIIEKVALWIEQNPKLTASIVGIALAGAALMTVIGTLGLAIPAIVAGFTFMAGTGGAVIGVLGGLVFAVTKVVGILDILTNHWEATWLGIKLITAETINSVIGVVEGMINKIISGINSFIGKINSVIKKANKVSGLDIGTIGTIGSVDLGRIDTQGIIDRSISNQNPQPNVVVTGNTLLSEDAAEEIGDKIMSKLKLSTAL